MENMPGAVCIGGRGVTLSNGTHTQVGMSHSARKMAPVTICKREKVSERVRDDRF